jgi:hypothetical protein
VRRATKQEITKQKLLEVKLTESIAMQAFGLAKRCHTWLSFLMVALLTAVTIDPCLSSVVAPAQKDLKTALRTALPILQSEYNKEHQSKRRTKQAASELKPVPQSKRFYAAGQTGVPSFLSLYEYSQPDCTGEDGGFRVLTYGTNMCLPITTLTTSFSSLMGDANSTMYQWDGTNNILRQLYFRDSSCTHTHGNLLDISFFVDFGSFPENTCTMDGWKYSLSNTYSYPSGRGTVTK